MSTDIARLFARDPLQHTAEDIRLIIAHFRESRTFHKTQSASPGTRRKLTTKEQVASNIAPDVDMSDL